MSFISNSDANKTLLLLIISMQFLVNNMSSTYNDNVVNLSLFLHI
jgi:hypothetical protein